MKPTKNIINVDELAQEIRRVDGNHNKGAGALAEALMPFLTAALAAMPAPAVKVKPLEWEQNEGDEQCFTQYTADTFGGSYCIEERLTGDFYLHIPGAAVSERFSSIAFAKAAAQKDHEARMRLPFDPAPDLAAENERLRAALDDLRKDMDRCEHDGGYDREIGPIGCCLGDKCVCMPLYMKINAALERKP